MDLPMSQDTTAAPLLDRLLHHAVVIITNGDSYRMRTPRRWLHTLTRPARWGISPGNQRGVSLGH